MLLLALCCFEDSAALAQAYWNTHRLDVYTNDPFDVDRYSLPMNREWKNWSENVDTYLKQDVEEKIRARSLQIGRVPAAAKVWFKVAAGKVSNEMIVQTSHNEKFDALVIESARSMSGRLVVLFPAGSKRNSISKTATVEPMSGAEEKCSGESWDKFMNGSCEFYIFNSSDRKNEKNMVQQIAEFNKNVMGRPPFKDFMSVECITDVQPKPDPDDGYGRRWWSWSEALDAQIAAELYDAAAVAHIKSEEVPRRCHVCFTVSNHAEVKDIKLTQSSTNEAFDRLVIETITGTIGKLISPFPKFSKRTSITKQFEFDLAVPSSNWNGAMERYFKYRQKL